MSFGRALILATGIHFSLGILIVLQVPLISIAQRPDLIFLGGILTEREVSPLAVQRDVLDKVFTNLPNLKTGIALRRWFYRQRLTKAQDKYQVLRQKQQYKSSVDEFAVTLDREDPLLRELGLDKEPIPRQPLRLERP